MLGAVLASPTMSVVLVPPWLLCTFLGCWLTCLSVLSFAPSWTQHKFDFGPDAPSGTLSGQAMEFKGLPQFERDFASFFVGFLAAMAALSLPQFGNPGMPSFLGDFFGAGYFMFDFKGLLWSFLVPVVVAAAMLAAAGCDVFVCGYAPFAWLYPTCFQPFREPPLRDAMMAALVASLLFLLVLTEGLWFVCGAGFCQNWFLTGSWIDFYILVNASDFGMGKDKGLKISLCIQEDVKRSPFQVGIEAARQLGSCISVGISAAAQISVPAAALMVGCVSVPIDGVSRLCDVLLIQVFMCVKEVLGALTAAAWDLVAATLFAAAAFPRAIQGFLTLVLRQFVLDGDFIFAVVGLGTTTLRHEHKGSRFAFEQAKATPRVDVAETPQASPFLEAQGETFIQSGPSLVSSRSLLVRALTGQTLVVRWSSSEDVLHCVSERTGVPLHAFYLALNGKCLTEETLHSMDRSSPIPLVMHGRLRGGSSSSVPGDWVCSRCHIGGCWPTKSRCYRCGAPRQSAPQDVGPALPRRESLHPGRAPKPKPAPVSPAFREPRVLSRVGCFAIGPNCDCDVASKSGAY